MNSVRLKLRLRLWSSRLSSLFLLFQRSPIIQLLFPEAKIIGGSAIADTATLAIATIAGLGAYDSVSGATSVLQVSPLANSASVPAATGSNLSFVYKNSNSDTPKAYQIISGTLPSGLTQPPPNQIQTGRTQTISGIPTQLGSWPITIKAWEFWNTSTSTGSGLYTTGSFTIYVLGFTTQPAATTTINSGGTTTLSCAVTGAASGATVAYQWYQGLSGDTTIAVGSNSSSFTTPALSTSTNYWVKVSSTLSTSTVSVNSNAAAVNIAAPPTVAVTPTGTFTNVSPITFTLTFSQAVTGLTTGGITVVNGTKGSLAGSGTTYTLPVTPAAQGAVTCQVNAGAASGNTVSNTASVTYDTVAPTVTINQAAGQADPTTAAPINYTVVFSEAVADFATGDVTIGGTAGGTKTATVTGSGTTYNVAVSGMTTTGTVIASLAAGVAHDAAGNASLASTSTDNTVTFNTPYTSWVSGLSPALSGPDQTPQNDGVKNLAKFAFNLNPLKPDLRVLKVGAGNTAGLPGGAMVSGTLRLEFLRRKSATNPGITYTPQFSSNVGSWVDAAVVNTPTSIDSTWERVVVDDPAPTGAKRFARVTVIQTP